ncbi:MAG TPA: biotin transporter BioY [Symbiobacteriaceae bacterium]|nr:biotin transporter BioY [Symbiobacteriaceae bacterium]
MKLSLRDMALVSVMTAVTAALGLLPPVPLSFIPVPITAQTLGVMLAGVVLGCWRGALCQVLLLLLVAVGAPVLSGGRGGFQVLVGPSAGFLWAWPVGAWLIGYLTERSRKLGIGRLMAYNMLGGIGVIYLIGSPVMGVMTGMPLGEAWMASLVFIPGDLIKAGVATVLGLAIRRALLAASLVSVNAEHGAD